ncbi:hypothetical protein EMIHUDRAFT_244552 [Emiliania huxleyi CCMP1516]|uniref:Uncharacterized protein n=2 Tax=Emiliania huxleyi TaxID=2903 RepID=A0A0D3J0J2_EMIH1|nr:hypothetical protein EMIHUDRAFT_244552 [Emiliania huxleyi CCMP1516]EOD17027.1 hypothetical protein EMIHUDRAFT_244552 [Emiliania huxleyi CCMP1516]|eukprot:XP_005769456.1 hypothetical protein EMIHUDRAFT_244552 [Emiliania huxleyi CCMP1516]
MLAKTHRLTPCPRHRDAAGCMMLFPRLPAYLTASNDGTLRVWRAPTLEHVATLRVCSRGFEVNATVLLPQPLGKVAVASSDCHVSYFDLLDDDRCGLHGRMLCPAIPIALHGWSLSGGQLCLAIGDVAGVARPLPLGKGVRTFLVTSLAPGRLRCASGGLERSVNVWSLENGELVGCLIGHHTSVTHLCLAPARKSGGSAPLHEPDLLISLDTQGTIRTWDLGMLIPVQCITHLHGAPERPTALVYDPLQALLITVSKRPVAWDRHADDSFGVGESGDDELATGASLPQLTSARARWPSQPQSPTRSW